MQLHISLQANTHTRAMSFPESFFALFEYLKRKEKRDPGDKVGTGGYFTSAVRHNLSNKALELLACKAHILPY